MAGKKLSQLELRKAMLNHKKKAGLVKKIDSPLAKYTDSGQLMCVLCKSAVKNETVWVVHLNSKAHKENVLSAKKTLEVSEKPVTAPRDVLSKRPCSPTREAESSKKIKGILKNAPPTSSLPSDFFDNPSTQAKPTIAVMDKNTEEVVSKLVAESTESETKNHDGTEGDGHNPAALPEGFFDDPILDAKVRNVEYKDPIEEEWEKFQKEIREEAAQSAQIIAEDQEEATTERQLDEIEEQIRNLSRVMDLVRRKEQVQAAEKKKESMDDDVSSGDDEDYDEFLYWRAKPSFK